MTPVGGEHPDDAESGYSAIRRCRICGSSDLKPVIDLGYQYVATHVWRDVDSEKGAPRYPLEVVRCGAAEGCGLVQLQHTVDPELLFADYGYRSGINRTMPANLAEIASEAARRVSLEAGDTVVDIGCNDGTLLDCYSIAGLDRVGFDPSRNVAELARSKGHNVLIERFSARSFLNARPEGRAKVVTSIAMFYDLMDPLGFCRDVASILARDGIWAMEMSYLPLMLQNGAYDTICHEHLEYYSLRQIEWLLQRTGLQIQHVALNAANGGSFRLFITHDDHGGEADDGVEALRKKERALRLDTEGPYEAFRVAVGESRASLRNLLARIAGSGETVYVYGASTKGNTLLQFCGIDSSMVPKAADRNPQKWGCRTPGTGIQIISEAQARSEAPDYFLVLPWHFFQEFSARERAFLDAGGRFILPLPEVRVIGQPEVG